MKLQFDANQEYKLDVVKLVADVKKVRRKLDSDEKRLLKDIQR